MNSFDRTLLIVLFLFAAALVFIRPKLLADNPLVESEREIEMPGSKGPAYLIANRPYWFAPPVGNFLPPQVASLEGEAVADHPIPKE